MDKYIGFAMDCKKTVCCVVQSGQKDRYQTIGADIDSMRRYLLTEKKGGHKVSVVFEISGQAGFIYDSLAGYADRVTVANPSKMTWIYRTAKKNDRIDARKMAVLLSIGEVPSVYMPSKEIRQWREMILHRKKIVSKVVQLKNRIRAAFKSQGYRISGVGKSWWTKANRFWMRDICEVKLEDIGLWRMHVGDLLDDG